MTTLPPMKLLVELVDELAAEIAAKPVPGFVVDSVPEVWKEMRVRAALIVTNNWRIRRRLPRLARLASDLFPAQFRANSEEAYWEAAFPGCTGTSRKGAETG